MTRAGPSPLEARGRPGRPAGPYLVAGLGEAGWAAANALLAVEAPEWLRAWDGAPWPGARERARRLDARGVRTSIGGDGISLLDADPPVGCLVKSPGIPFTAPVVARALAHGVPVMDEAELGWRLDGRPLVGVTGTNGKSTVAALACATIRAGGRRPVLAGNTHFGPPLSGLAGRAGDVVVGELSSFQLEGCPSLMPDVAVLTNLTEDHLDRHGTMERYEECKRRLFVDGERSVGMAVLNIDDPFGRRLAAELGSRGTRVLTFGGDRPAEYRVEDCAWTLRSGSVSLQTPRGSLRLDTRLPGPHNALNLAAAVALGDALGVSPGAAGEAIAANLGVPGRLEAVGDERLDVVIDFAHNPDGIRRTLETLRAVVDRRPGACLRVVASARHFVEGGQRRTMGRTLGALSHRLILTTARWWPGEARAVAPDLVAGARSARGAEVEVEVDRRIAIGRAVGAGLPGDVVAILGRGAQAGLLYDPEDRPRRFDDRVEARRALNGMLPAVV